MSFARSTIWTMMQRYLPSIIHIISTLVITRMILPSDFGEVALVLTFYQISILLVSSGLGEGLIYNVNNNDRIYSTIFYLNLIVAVFLYGILFFFSNDLASFYGIERISILTKIIGLNIIIFALSYIQKIQFQITSSFKKLAIAAMMSSFLGSIIGIVMAFQGFGIWAIVIQTLSINLIEMIFLWVYSSWHPIIAFSMKEVSHFIPYSAKILLNNILTTLYDNLYSLVLGRVYNSKTLGYYNRMQTVVFFTTTNFVYSIEMVFFPILCERKDRTEDLQSAHEKLIRMATFFTLPLLCMMGVLAKNIIIFVLTENWIGGVEILQLLSMAFMFVPIIYISNSFLKILGKTGLLFNSNMIKKIVGVLILIVTVRYNITIVCYGIIIYYAIDSLISMFCVSKFLGTSLFYQIAFLKENVLINGICSLIILLVSNNVSNISLNLFICILIYVFMYLVIHQLLRTKEAELLKVILRQLRNKK